MYVEFSLWLPWYEKIRRAFGISVKKDREAARILWRIVNGNVTGKDKLSSLIKGKDVFVFGAGPSLEEDIERLSCFRKNSVFVAADGASIALSKRGIVPDIVVTDLDGIAKKKEFEDIIYVVHAHGDNQNLLRRIVPRLKKIHPTTQAEPFNDVFNYGGFMDGDRAVYLADEFNARTIILAGMDLGREIGEYSNVLRKDLTIRKMRYSKKLLEFLSTRTDSILLNATSGGVEINGFRRVKKDQLEKYIRVS
jgi:uncharacterized Rossmann fold enzyme